MTDAFERRGDRDHASGLSHLFHQLPALRHESCCVCERERARSNRRGEFPDTVSDHQAGQDVPTAPQRHQPDLQCKERRLGIDSAVKTFLIGAKHDTRQGDVKRLEHSKTAIERGTEDGLAPVKLLAHAETLRSLPREEKRERPLGLGAAPLDQPVRQLLLVATDHAMALRKMMSAEIGREA